LNDFGCAKTLSKTNNPYVVSQYYWAPELLFGIKSYNTTIDLWATAVIFYEFLFKWLPF
jgi:serine/threonine protein kinase